MGHDYCKGEDILSCRFSQPRKDGEAASLLKQRRTCLKVTTVLQMTQMEAVWMKWKTASFTTNLSVHSKIPTVSGCLQYSQLKEKQSGLISVVVKFRLENTAFTKTDFSGARN